MADPFQYAHPLSPPATSIFVGSLRLGIAKTDGIHTTSCTQAREDPFLLSAIDQPEL